MLSSDLAELYQVPPKALIQAVKRNLERFPPDFMFQLEPAEVANLKSQSVTSSWGGVRRAMPYDAHFKVVFDAIRRLMRPPERRERPQIGFRRRGFTEHGAVMLASVLNSPIAVAASIQVVGAFIQLSGMLAAHAELARKAADLERKYDAHFRVVFDAIRELMEPPPPPPHKRIGFPR